ncbi:hypothetical protein [Paraburkholderia sp.]|uniref:hypothetical protein n=1 Tax=Paraburkholderia sp. TaxID=1926495 RepID=UPI0039E450F7
MLVTEYEPDFLSAPLAADGRFRGAYTIVDSTLPRARDEALDDPQRILAMTKKAGETWHNGKFTIVEPLGGMGWMLVHTYTWRDIIASMGHNWLSARR